MHVLRPIEESDEKAFISLAFTAQSGITSLPKDEKLLKAKLNKSIISFNKKVLTPHDELYLFVLEDRETQTINGICGIYATSGLHAPTYYYQILNETPARDRVEDYSLSLRQLIQPVSYTRGPTEISSLFLRSNARRGGLGKLLSLARFLFIAAYPNRFHDMIIANLRGILNQTNTSPMWEAIGRRFLDIEFDRVQELIQRNPSSIHALVPEKPIYTALIAQEARDALGNTHPNTLPAKTMLLQQGFELTNEIDPFDGGPKLKASTKKIPVIAMSQTSHVHEIINTIDSSEQYFICNDQIKFRASYGKILIHNNQTIIDAMSAKTLGLKIGDPIRYYKLENFQ